jgi:transposase
LLPEYLGRQRVAAGLRRIPEGGASRLRALAGALFRPKTIPASGQGAKRVSRIACEGAPLGSRRKRGEWAQAVGRSRGGRTSKIHCLADDRGRPVAFALTPGNVADISMAVPLLSAVTSPKHLIADKAYDADSLRNWLKTRRVNAVIPSTATRTVPYPLDRAVYRRRNLIERLFCRLKNWRRLATRYDRLARNYIAALALVSVIIEWI